MEKKYIIELKDNTAWLQWVNVVDDGQVRFDFKYPEDMTPYTEPDLDAVRKEAYEQGLNGAWECVRKLFSLTYSEQGEIFRTTSVRDIARKYSASEAIEKICQYEQEELGIQGYFKNGEEVIDADGTKAVILCVSEDNYCQVYTEKGCIENWHIHTYKFHKTGKIHPEVGNMLKNMRREEE